MTHIGKLQQARNLQTWIRYRSPKQIRALSNNRPLSHGSHFESQENKKLCPSSLALDESWDEQNLQFVPGLRDKVLFQVNQRDVSLCFSYTKKE